MVNAAVRCHVASSGTPASRSPRGGPLRSCTRAIAKPRPGGRADRIEMQPLVGAQRTMQPDGVVSGSRRTDAGPRSGAIRRGRKRRIVEPPVGKVGKSGGVQMRIVAETVLQANPRNEGAARPCRGGGVASARRALINCRSDHDLCFRSNQSRFAMPRHGPDADVTLTR